MADYPIFTITTLEDVTDPMDGVVSLREALACAIACVQNAPDDAEPVTIAFDETLFTADSVSAVLQSALEIPADVFSNRQLIISAPEGKQVNILAPSATAPWSVASGNDVNFSNVAIQSGAVASLAAALPPMVGAVEENIHLYVNPDYAVETSTEFQSVDHAVAAHPQNTGAITVEKAGATTTIGALTYSGRIFGGAEVTGGTVTNNSSLVVAVGSGESARYHALFGGCEVDASTTPKVIGDSSLTIGGAGTIDIDLAFGGLYLASGTVNVSGASALTISSGTFHSVVCGGHVAGGTSTQVTVLNDSTCTLTISGGVFLKEVAAGCYNQAGKFDIRHVTNTLMISGGTFHKSVYGGNLAKTQVLAKAAINMNLNSTVNVTIDSSENEVYLLKNVVLGSRYQGSIRGKTTMTFSGIAENLNFDANTLVVGDSECATDDEHRITNYDYEKEKFIPGRELVFDHYCSSQNGGVATFAPLDLLGFDEITFSGSTVSFSGAGRTAKGFDLQHVQRWNFEYGSTLIWTNGTNDFITDAMSITLSGQSVDAPWTIIDGSADTLFRWNQMGEDDVTIDGTEAIWDEANQWYATNEYKIYCEDNKLKLAKLAILA